MAARRARASAGDRMRGGRRQRRHLLPFRQPAPDPQRLGRRAGAGCAAAPRRTHRRPAPAGLAHARCQRRRLAVERRARPAASRASSASARSGSSDAGGLQAAADVDIQRQGKAARRRAPPRAPAARRRTVPAGRGRALRAAEPAQRGRRMHQQRRRQGPQQPRRLVGRQRQQFAVRRENGGAAHPGHNRRRHGQQDAGSKASSRAGSVMHTLYEPRAIDQGTPHP